MKSPYTRPFDHPDGCGCVDCEMRRNRRFRLKCTAVLVLIVLTGITAFGGIV